MSDNFIVKSVAGTCITFSFILAGKTKRFKDLEVQDSQSQEMP
jgi:hypothetical protein